MSIPDDSAPEGQAGTVLVVDDMATTRAIHRALLSKHYSVQVAASGSEALEVCKTLTPDLVLLDVEMPGLNGFDTCRKLREQMDVPIIFVTAHETLEEHLKAYDAGGTDIIVKPVSAEIMLRKAALAIQHHHERLALKVEKASLQDMAMSFLSSAGETGALLEFTRAGLACRSHEALARLFIKAAEGLGVDCCVAIRHDAETTVMSANGEASELERSVIAQMSKMGRIFQFKRRLAINYDKVTVVAHNMPDEGSEQAGRLRDNLAILAETTEPLSENVTMRLESSSRAEQMQLALAGAVTAADGLRERHRKMVLDVRMLLQELGESVETTYSWLAADRSQEMAIIGELHGYVERILATLLNADQFDDDFEKIFEPLRGPGKGDDIMLF